METSGENMSRNFIIVSILILVFSVVLTGCVDDKDNNTRETKSDFDKFIGTWRSSQRSDDSIFREDGTGNDGNDEFNWEILDGKLRLFDDNMSETFAYNFSEGDNTLTLFLEEGTIIFERV